MMLVLTDDSRWVVLPELRAASELEVDLWRRCRLLEAQIARVRLEGR